MNSETKMELVKELLSSIKLPNGQYVVKRGALRGGDRIYFEEERKFKTLSAEQAKELTDGGVKVESLGIVLRKRK